MKAVKAVADTVKKYDIVALIVKFQHFYNYIIFHFYKNNTNPVR